ncbi:MAG: hypothetical protein K2P20_05505 [Oscillospiraceae bacterium]|nr:hypothetical protein [Oscillospiraceae bacterium]
MMKLRTKVLLSVAAGFLAMLLYSAPMWWGVLFSPLTQPLSTAEPTEETSEGLCWESEGVTVRLRSLDLLLSLLHLS